MSVLKKEKLQECLHCRKRLPASSYDKGRNVCRPCRSKQKVEYNRIYQKKHRNNIVLPIDPLPPLKKKKAKAAKKKATTTTAAPPPTPVIKDSFGNRSSAEAYVADQIRKDIDALDDLIGRYEGMLDDTMVVKEQKDVTARIEACVQKRVELSMKLVKAFDLFSDLGRPVDDDPLYTPVYINIVTTMPESCIVPDKFHRAVEEIQHEEVLKGDGYDDNNNNNSSRD